MRSARRTGRLIAVAVLAALGPGLWLAVVGAAAYLHSPLYRLIVERRLTTFFGLPTQIGRVVPVSWDERDVLGVRIFLPDASGRARPTGRIGACRLASWRRADSADRKGLFDLTLYGGQLDLTPARWAEGDFRRIERSLRHDYAEVGLHRIDVYNSSARWSLDGFDLDLGAASGRIALVNHGTRALGEAAFSAGRLNGEPARVQVRARFDPLSEAASDVADGQLEPVHQAVAVGPDDPVPVRLLRLDRLLDGPVNSGQFSGRLTYRAPRGGRPQVLALSQSKLVGLELAELSGGLAGGSVAGRLDLTVDRLEVHGRQAMQLVFSGTLANLDLAAATAAVGLAPCQGRLRLDIDKAELIAGQPATVRASGTVGELDLAEFSRLWRDQLGPGRIHGPGRFRLLDLAVDKGRLRSLRAELSGTDPSVANTVRAGISERRLSKPAACRVERELINAVVAKAVGFRIPALPEGIDYRNLALAAENTDEGLKLIGLGGTDKRSLMTLDLGVANLDVPPPSRPLNMEPLRRRLAAPLAPIALDALLAAVRGRTHAATRPAATTPLAKNAERQAAAGVPPPHP